jgi:hypothetical protein
MAVSNHSVTRSEVEEPGRAGRVRKKVRNHEGIDQTGEELIIETQAGADRDLTGGLAPGSIPLDVKHLTDHHRRLLPCWTDSE